ncbi:MULTISPECIES: type II secretion system F family protein [Paraliobacillus]|uniref:type II secretion system F family protein n=1 Tax=Paraliobacillus TaxID=200903 RepID=UPI000DD4869F|nr:MULTISPECIES: type II secretion system F family protein [Paraliobacillus]
MDMQSIRNIVFIKKSTTLSLDEQNKFLIRLARLLEQHYTLLDALVAMQWNQKWENHSKEIITTLKEGNSITLALERAKFDSQIISFLFFSMAHGDIRKALKQSIQLISQQLTLIQKFKQAIRYPFVLFIMFILLLYFIKTSVYPSFIQLFSSTAYTSDLTIFSIRLINVLFTVFIICFVAISLGFLYWIYVKKNLSIETKLIIYERIPLIKKVIRLHTTFLFSLHLSSLLQAGLSLKECFEVLSKQQQLPLLSYYCDILMQGLQRGQAISTILPSCTLLEHDINAIFQKNVTNNLLIKDLKMYADFLIELIEIKVKKIITRIQPIFFVVMALSIIFIYLSLLLPMFQLINTI